MLLQVQIPGMIPAMLVYTTPKTWSFPFTITGLANTTTPTTLKLVVWGGTDWQLSPDHHLKVSLNGVPIADQTFDGLAEQILESLCTSWRILLKGVNTLQLTLPGDTGVQL